MDSKISSLLGFAQKAGACVSGENACDYALKNTNKAKLLICNSALSERSKTHYAKKCGEIGIELIETDIEFGAAVGKPGRKVVLITDKGFAERIITQFIFSRLAGEKLYDENQTE